MQSGDVQSLIAEEHQNSRGTDGIDGDIAAAAPGHGFAQRALADLPGDALSDGQRSGEPQQGAGSAELETGREQGRAEGGV